MQAHVGLHRGVFFPETNFFSASIRKCVAAPYANARTGTKAIEGMREPGGRSCPAESIIGPPVPDSDLAGRRNALYAMARERCSAGMRHPDGGGR